MTKIKIYRKKPTITYSGSVIQQNYGESLNKHGYLIWDIKNKNYEEVDIPNKYGYVTLFVDGGKIENENDVTIPEKPRIRLKIKETSPTQLKDVVIYLRQKYNPIEVIINRNHDAILNKTEHKFDLSRIREVDFQNELIKDYLQTNFQIDDDLLQKIFDINKKLNLKLPNEDVIRNIVWKPKRFKFANMFSYGEENVVDFSKMGGIVGLFSSNASGKTSLLEALTFCLFDKCSKSFKASNVLNSQKDQFWCELNFEINGVDYFVKRVAKKTSSGGVNVKVDFYKMLPDGTTESLNGEQRRDTDSIIKSYIGTYEDFILTAVSSQNNSANFIDKSQTERKDLLAQFMDITIFDNLYDMASNDIKEYSILLKQFERRDFDAEIHSCKTEYESLKSEYDLYDKQKTVLLVKKTKYEEQIIDLAKKITPVDKSIVDIKTLEQQKTETEKLIPELESEINQLLNNLSEKESYYNKITSFVDTLKSMNIESDYEKVILLENELQSINVEIDKFKIQIQNKLDKADKLLKVEYDPNCKFCMNNIFVKDAIVAKQELIDDKKLYDEMIANRNNFILELEPLSKTKDLYDKLYKANSAISQTKMEILQLKNIISEKQNEMQSKKTYLLQINDDIDKYHKNKEYIESNKEIESDINNIKEQISKLNLDIDEFETNIRQKHSKMILLDEKIKSINNDINEFKKMEQEYNCYNYYLECVNRDSIPYQLILKTIPVIESEINNILSQMVDFTIMLDADNKNINIKIVYSEDRFWSVEMASGMERFITGISIRMALLSISNLPRPNFLAVDEGFSTLDANNMSNLPLIFDYLRSQMDFILIISHLDHIRDFVDLSLDLKKENDFSKITFK